MDHIFGVETEVRMLNITGELKDGTAAYRAYNGTVPLIKISLCE